MLKFSNAGYRSVWGALFVLFAFVLFVQVQSRTQGNNPGVESFQTKYRLSSYAMATEAYAPEKDDASETPFHYVRLPLDLYPAMDELIFPDPQDEPAAANSAMERIVPELPSAGALLIEAVIMVESQGDPMAKGAAGERGLMQIMPGTWKETSRKLYGEPVSFDRAFDPDTNREVGARYLVEIQRWLAPYQEDWNSDLRSLMLACYNAGFTTVSRNNFNVEQLPKQVQSYVRRCSALHDSKLLEVHGDDLVRID